MRGLKSIRIRTRVSAQDRDRHLRGGRWGGAAMARGLGLGLAVLWIVSADVGAIAATSSQIDILSDDAARNTTDTIDVGAVRPIASPAQQPSNKPVPRGNPLWS